MIAIVLAILTGINYKLLSYMAQQYQLNECHGDIQK